MAGKVIAAGVGLALLAGAAAGAVSTRRMMRHDERFVIAAPEAIETAGNQRVSRQELLGALHGDVGTNVFSLSLEAQRARLEALPWVEGATVMRLLPDHLRASVVERRPIAFVRERGQIGLVDGHGVLLDLREAPAGGEAGASYSFPVVTGVMAADPASTRAARMKIFEEFVADLDASGEHISAKLSEVDLSNPEDVKALIPDSGAEVLVHFGDSDYLARYRKYQAHLGEWRSHYPKLASVDMRYDRQAVLEMQPGSPLPLNSMEPVVTTAAAKPMASMSGQSAPRRTGAPKGADHRPARQPARILQAEAQTSKGHGPRFGGAIKHLAAKAVHR